MSAEINYKNKYMELRSKYMNDLDMAFRLGFEQGSQQAQQDQMAQEQQQAQEMQQAAASGMNGGAPGQPGQGSEQPGEEQNGMPGQETGAQEAAGGGSELDQHISKLEQAIAKSEKLSEDDDIKKSLENLKAMRKSETLNAQIRKNNGAISAISKALHKPAFKMNKQASINLNDNAKTAISMQQKIVTDVMAKMEAEEKRASTDIQKVLSDITKA